MNLSHNILDKTGILFTYNISMSSFLRRPNGVGLTGRKKDEDSLSKLKTKQTLVILQRYLIGSVYDN